MLSIPSSAYIVCTSLFFFFQAEDGIRDSSVTGVQTCALPILVNTILPVEDEGQVVLSVQGSQFVGSPTCEVAVVSGTTWRPLREPPREPIALPGFVPPATIHT